MRSSGLLSAAFLFTSTCSAWPAQLDAALNVIQREVAPLYRRQTTSYNLSPSLVQGNTATTVTSTSDANGAKTNDAKATTTGHDSSSGNSTSTSTTTGKGSEATTKTFNPEDPAGGISMITPAATTTTFYKIKDYVTFSWNYTSLSATPSHIDILASCAENQATYTLALNQSVTASTGAFTWDTGAYQASATVPLLTETYTLIIYDAQKPITAAPSAGYLSTFDTFTFGMYVPQPYQPLNDFVCATCNAAMSSAQVQTLWFLFGTAGVTMMSAAWFAGVAGFW